MFVFTLESSRYLRSLLCLPLFFIKNPIIWGPWHFNSLSWLLAVFVLTMGLIVQRYSVHYLLGDRSYRKYFSLLTLTTVACSLAWLSDDLRLLFICWGTTLFGLTLIIRLKKEWQVAETCCFPIWANCLRSVGFSYYRPSYGCSGATGHWQLSQVMIQDSLTGLESWERTCIQSATDPICRDSSSAMAFPTLVIRIGSGSNSCFSCYACWNCECWWHYINSFCTTI